MIKIRGNSDRIKRFRSQHSFNAAYITALTRGVVWFHPKRRRCTICNITATWCSQNLMWYTNEKFYNKEYAFCEGCAAEIDPEVSRLHHFLVMQTLDNFCVLPELALYVKLIYANLFLYLPGVPRHITNKINKLELQLAYYASFKVIDNDKLDEIARYLGIFPCKDVWQAMKLIVKRKAYVEEEFISYCRMEGIAVVRSSPPMTLDST